MQPIYTHDRVLSLIPENPGGRRQPSPRRSVSERYAGLKKLAIDFWNKGTIISGRSGISIPGLGGHHPDEGQKSPIAENIVNDKQDAWSG
jgi:hypothetical protein